jgi:hypothetical protein
VCLANGTCCSPTVCTAQNCGYSGSNGCGGTITCPACPPP